jgi:hypothetical protein
VQVAQRDLEYAEAIAARFPEGSALGIARNRAEEEHAVAVAAIGASIRPGTGYRAKMALRLGRNAHMTRDCRHGIQQSAMTGTLIGLLLFLNRSQVQGP